MQAHLVIQQYLKAGGIAVDATVGNGHDTLFIAQQVGPTGKVFGFDIQQQAIELTQARLNNTNITNNTQLFHTSHINIEKYLGTDFGGKINVIMFNLGYLPGSDKSIITQAESTLSALNQAISLLAKSGIITIAAYPGHPGGDKETDAIKAWHKQLAADKYKLKTIYSANKETAPRLYIIQKLTE